MTSLRVLVVGRDCPITERLEGSGHHVTPVDECEIAVEALHLQSFDAVVLGENVSRQDLQALAREVHALNSRSNGRTAVLGMQSESDGTNDEAELDGYLSTQAGAEALSEVLAGAPGQPARSKSGPSDGNRLPVFDLDEFRQQLDFDHELMLELIELYLSERKRQSVEMSQALASGDLNGLSRLAHTIKGSLGSLQAPAARAEAQLLEIAANNNDRSGCERLLPKFERKLDELEVELNGVNRSMTA